MRWVIDGNNVFGSRPDGWWNDRDAAAGRLAQSVAEWCRTHDDDVVLVFDAPVAADTVELGGGNLTIVESLRRGRDAADDTIVDLVAALEADVDADFTGGLEVQVVTSDRGLRGRLPERVSVIGAGRFLGLIEA